MKKYIVPVALLFVLAVCAQAQTAQETKTNKANKNIEQAFLKANKAAKAKKVCAYCGEEIISNGQHCTSADNGGLCTTVKQTAKTENFENTYIGSGDPHNCANHRKAGYKCVGNDPYDPASWVKADEAKKAAKVNEDPSYAPGEGYVWNGRGDPHNSDNWVKGVEKAQEPVRSTYTGRDPHNPDNYLQEEAQPAKAAKKICAYCGEEIISNGQHCSGLSYNGLCSTEKTIERPTNVPEEFVYLGGDPHNDANWVCPECGRTKEKVAIHGHNHKKIAVK